MAQNKKQVQEIEQRSVALFRIKSEPKGMDVMLRNYQPYEGSPYSTIADLADALEGMYDILVLHDERDGCLVVGLSEGKPPEVGKLPCKLHPNE